MRHTNLVVICSDQHSSDAMGCAGHPVVNTPHLDALAAMGTRFTNAYTACPICVPARASLATGRHVHEIGNWDNSFPYTGEPEGWAHRIRDAGHRVDSIGKLHFRSEDDDYGFTAQTEPLNVVGGVGDLVGAIREDPPLRNKRAGITGAGSGDTSYIRYDIANAKNARQWIVEHQHDEKPWVLFLSFACPHPPYVVPERYFSPYAAMDFPLPPQWRREDWPTHDAIDHFRRFFGFSTPFDEETVRKLMAAYYGLCTFIDERVGEVMDTLSDCELLPTTRVVYTSDHGESLGARGIFGKFTMYEESVAVPLIAAGSDFPSGKIVRTPVSLVDLYPTVLAALGVEPLDTDEPLPGRSLFESARTSDERMVLSQYHAVGSTHASFMLRNEKYKFIYYVGDAPQLFDLEQDPTEVDDLARSPRHQRLVERFDVHLRSLLDPEAVDARAKADQASKVERYGGREAVMSRGTFDNSPVPGEQAAFKPIR